MPTDRALESDGKDETTEDRPDGSLRFRPDVS